MNIKKLCYIIFAIAVLVCGCTDGKDLQDKIPDVEYTVELESVYDGSELDILNKNLRRYLELTDESEQAEFLSLYSGFRFDGQAYSLSWKSNGSKKYTVFIADNENFENALTAITTLTKLTVGLLVPGTKYYWKVADENGGESKVDTFTAVNAPCRIVTIEGAYNIRDMGGWKTESGKTVKYGLVYRGGRLNKSAPNVPAISESGIASMRDVLGIKTEIDLRNGLDNDGQSISMLGSDVSYLTAPVSQYGMIIPEFSHAGRNYDKSSVLSLQKIFAALSDKSNYPIYYHCNLGADRTGTIAFLLNGLLGVSYEDLTRDFEITSFSNYGKRWRSAIEDNEFTENGIMQDDAENFVAWGEMYNLIMKNYAMPNKTLSAAIENYLITVIGCTSEQLQFIKNIMLED